MTIDQSIELTAIAVQRLAETALARAEAAGAPSSDTSAGLHDGLEIVRDYLRHNESGIAFEHVVYMIRELDLALPPDIYSQLAKTALGLGVDSTRLADVRLKLDDS